METRSSKVIFIVAVAALVVALGAITIAGIALAQGDDNGRARLQMGPGMMRGDIGQRLPDEMPRLRNRLKMPGPGMGLEEAAEALGLTEQELRTQLADGKTLAEIAGEKGVNTQTLVDAMTSQAKADLAEQVANGELTQAEADETLRVLTDRVKTFIDSGMPDPCGIRRGSPSVQGTASSQAT